MNEIEIKNLELSKLKPYERNNRSHSGEHIKRIAESINQFGYNQPIIVDENLEILAGHGRYYALLELGREEAPVIVKDTLDDDQKRLYRIIDNKLDTEGHWDFDNLALEIEELDSEDVDFWKLDDLNLDDPPQKEEVNFEASKDDSSVTIRIECYVGDEAAIRSILDEQLQDFTVTMR